MLAAVLAAKLGTLAEALPVWKARFKIKAQNSFMLKVDKVRLK